MEYLLSIGLNFDFSLTVLELLMAKGLFLSAKSWGKDQTRLMFVLGLDNQEVQLEIFNVELAKQKWEEGYPVVPFYCDRIYDKLNSIQIFLDENI